MLFLLPETMDTEHALPLDPITGLPWSAALRSTAADWAMTGEVHAVVLQVAGLSVLIDVFGYRAAHSILGQVGRLLTRQLGEQDMLGRHSGNAFLILTQRPYAEIETLVREAIGAAGAKSPGDMGRVMKELMPKVAGRADGKTVNEIVRRLLASVPPRK